MKDYVETVSYTHLGECKRRAVRLYDLDGNMIEVGEVSWQRV